MELVEPIHSRGKLLAFVIRVEWAPEKTTFVTPEDCGFQLGCFVYAAGSEVAAHMHHHVTRSVHGTSEFLLVRKGRCQVDLYDEYRQVIRTVDLRQGDAILMMTGGHGLRMLDDTDLLSIKQGPYPGPTGKEHF